ncbi:MAG: hypothetical protein INQ03_24980 [Candidatus Heimdallarchaeota archaeon]|nr:hypothetical protein [Candidatus Heimdallarchaeota archaeon]
MKEYILLLVLLIPISSHAQSDTTFDLVEMRYGRDVDLVMDRDNNIHRVWFASVYDDGLFIDYQVVYQSKDHDADDWNEAVIVPSPERSNSEPKIVIDSEGNPHIIWRGSSNSPEEDSGIGLYHIELDIDTLEWSEPKLQYKIDSIWDPEIVIDSADMIHVVYSDLWKAYHTIFNTASNLWLSTTELPGYGQPAVCIDSDDQLHVITKEGNEIHYTKRYISGSWRASEVISTESEYLPMNTQTQVVVKNGRVHVAWLDSTEYKEAQRYDTNIFYKSLDLSVTSWSKSQVISVRNIDYTNISANVYNFQMALDNDGLVLFSWYDKLYNYTSAEVLDHFYFTKDMGDDVWETIPIELDNVSEYVQIIPLVDSNNNIYLYWQQYEEYYLSATSENEVIPYSLTYLLCLPILVCFQTYLGRKRKK